LVSLMKISPKAQVNRNYRFSFFNNPFNEL
jgi:hypothetical protein